MRHTPDLSRISESLTAAFGAREVYGEPVERDGAIVIPAARMWSSGGAGGGGGAEPRRPREAPPESLGGPDEPDAEQDALAEGHGGGMGFGRRAEPAGAFVVDAHGVRWVPAVAVNRIVLGGQVAFVLAVAVVGWAVSRRRRP